MPEAPFGRPPIVPLHWTYAYSKLPEQLAWRWRSQPHLVGLSQKNRDACAVGFKLRCQVRQALSHTCDLSMKGSII